MTRKIILLICSVLASVGIVLFFAGFALIAAAGRLAMHVEV
jgi:hypothetical protein